MRVGDWAVEEVFGVDPGLLNDDRLARALDAIAPQLEQITGSVGAQAIAETIEGLANALKKAQGGDKQGPTGGLFSTHAG